jgi:hypothetical protein
MKKHGEYVTVIRGRRRYSCKVLSDHTDSYPAITVERNGEPWIVGTQDILTAEEILRETKEKHDKEVAKVQDIVDAYLAGNHTMGDIARFLKTKQVQILSRCRKAERLGLIKLNRRKHANIISKPGNPPEPMPDLQPLGLVPDGGEVHIVHEANESPTQNPVGREPGLAPSGGGESPGTETGKNGETSTAA